jgi:hypothetical protein
MRKFFKNPFWTKSWPVWNSRPNAEGQIMSWCVPGYMFFLGGLMVQFNVLLWSGIGLWKAVEVIV